MKATTRQYLFAAAFFCVAIYQWVNRDMLEVSLYATAASAFLFNTLAMEPKLIRHRKTLSIITWILIAATAILFLYLIQFKYL